jgi:hypothetical protein
VIKEKVSSKRKIIQRILIGIVVLGVVIAILRMALVLFGMLNLPGIMNTNTTGVIGQPSSGFMSAFNIFIFAIAPYVIAFGGVAAFLHTYLFPDKESRSVLVGWGILMIAYSIAILHFAWL